MLLALKVMLLEIEVMLLHAEVMLLHAEVMPLQKEVLDHKKRYAECKKNASKKKTINVKQTACKHAASLKKLNVELIIFIMYAKIVPNFVILRLV